MKLLVETPGSGGLCCAANSEFMMICAANSTKDPPFSAAAAAVRSPGARIWEPAAGGTGRHSRELQHAAGTVARRSHEADSI